MTDTTQKDSLAFPLDKIVLGQNPRTVLSGIADLATSIKENGIISPLTAILQEDGTALLLGGHRRYHAAKQLGLTEVPVRFLMADEDKRQRIAIIDNLQREDMNSLDKAVAIQKMIEKENIEQKDAARFLGVSEGFISQHLTLLKLPKKIQGAVKSGNIELAHARQLARVRDEEQALEFLKQAPSLTSSALSDKIDVYIQKEREKEAKAAEREKKKVGAKRREKLGIEEPEEAPETTADGYSAESIKMVTPEVILDALKFYANKMDRANTDAKRLEHKFVLRGLEIAAGLFQFTP